MKNLDMMNTKRILGIEKREKEAIADAKRATANAYKDMIVEALDDGKTLLRGLVRDSDSIHEATLQFKRAEVLTERHVESEENSFSVYVEMTEVDTKEAYAFSEQEILNNFVIVETDKG